jgi:hypothetical protein
VLISDVTVVLLVLVVVLLAAVLGRLRALEERLERALRRRHTTAPRRTSPSSDTRPKRKGQGA